MITEKEIKKIKIKYEEEMLKKAEKVSGEESPKAQSVWDHTYVNNENSDWRKF